MINYLTGQKKEVRPPKYPRCEHGVEMYCRECLKELGLLEEENREERVSYEVRGGEEIEYPLFGRHKYEVLYRIGYYTMHRFAGRYVQDLPPEVIQDAIHDAILELCIPGALNVLRDEAEEAGVPPAAVFARRVRNAFKRELRRCSLFRPGVMAVSVDDEEAKQYNVLHHSSLPSVDMLLQAVEREEFMKQSLSLEEYATAKMLLQGYSAPEIAAKLRKGRRTVERYINGVKRGFMLYNMA